MNRKKVLIISGVVLVVAAIIGVLYFMVFNKDESNAQSEEPVKYYSQLTGTEIPQDIAERPILGVMIENSEFARPQTGLDSAGMVYEAVTEGGITRYLALYQEDMPEAVGPVRSVRTHFVDWLMGYDASVAHVGGSEEALRLIDERNARTLSQFKYPEPYYRDDKREAPHNMYARTKDLRDLQKELNHTKADFTAFPWSDGAASEVPTASKISVDFSGPVFAVEFRYDKATNSYIRYLAGEPHIDTVTNRPITVKNVVVIKAQGVPNGVNAIGSGEALLFKDGNVQKIKWEKKSYSDQIRFTDDQGQDVALNRGQTWICAVSTDRPVSYQ